MIFDYIAEISKFIFSKSKSNLWSQLTEKTKNHKHALYPVYDPALRIQILCCLTLDLM